MSSRANTVVFFLCSQKRVCQSRRMKISCFFFLVFLQFFRSIDLPLLVKKISLLFFCTSREFCGASLLLELYDESFINTQHVQKII